MISQTNLTNCTLKYGFTELPKHWHLEPFAVLQAATPLSGARSDRGRPSAAPSNMWKGCPWVPARVPAVCV